MLLNYKGVPQMSIYISTNIVFLSNQKENLSKLKDFIFDLKANSGIENDFGKDWLGHLAFNLCKKKGLSDEESKEAACYSSDYAGCRGTLESVDFDEDGSRLEINTETKNNSAYVIFKEALALSGLENVEFYWLDFYENGEIETNDSKQVVFKGDYFIDHECELNFMEVASEPDTYTKEEARKIFINLLTSKYVHQDDALTQEEAEKLTTEELFNLVDSAEFYDDNDDEIFLVVKEVSYV